MACDVIVAGSATIELQMELNTPIDYGVGEWNANELGNHRVVLRVSDATDAVRIRIPWRRRDQSPEAKAIIIVDAATNEPVTHIARFEIGRESGDIGFQPVSGPGLYYVYYLPFINTGRVNYPTITYPQAPPATDSAWLDRVTAERDTLPMAAIVAFEAADEFNRFTEMEVIATEAEVDVLLATYPHANYFVFPEDRAHVIRMTDDLPQRWITAKPGQTLRGEALRGEFYTFQLGVFAARQAAMNVHLVFSDLHAEDGFTAIPAAALRCFNLAGVSWDGRDFQKVLTISMGKVQTLWCGLDVPEDIAVGEYRGTITISAQNASSTTIAIHVTVLPDQIVDHGDNEMNRLSRLRWLDSRIALDDEVVAPFTPMIVQGNTVGILGREVKIGPNGLPQQITSRFAPEITHLIDAGRDVLSAPLVLLIESPNGAALPWTHAGVVFTSQTPGRVTWEATSVAGVIDAHVRAVMECDGNIEYTMALRAGESCELNDVRLEIPVAGDVAKYSMGLGLKGGIIPGEYIWQWDVSKNQDGAWIGDVNAGLQFTLKDECYERPLNTNFYQLKPLVMPSSWYNDGRGSINMHAQDAQTYIVKCSSGQRTFKAGETLYYNVRLLITPFKPIDTNAQWSTRFYHRYSPLDTVASAGANTINVHHATPVNPYINYPFFRNDDLKAYVDAAHARDMKMKLYYTVRELTNRAPELFALRSLGDEVLTRGPGGGWAWLQEHLGEDYIAGWFVPELQDAAVINSGMSRWLNFYLEGLDWLARHIGIDGLYIDDVAYDRTIMKRVRKILDRHRSGAVIDLHSANQYNPRDGFANSAGIYMEHFPYLNRLWFGEYFDYNAAPDFWLIEISGIPFGLMGEMLQDGGNPWRGMIYGMTSRAPWAGNPQALWQAWDAFGMADSRMIGYWVAGCPVRTSHPEVLATVYVAEGRALIAIASWAKESVVVTLSINWTALGIDPSHATLRAPAMADFQEAACFEFNSSAGMQKQSSDIPVESGRGWLLVVG